MLKKITAVKKKAQKDGLWGLVTDVLQTVTGAAITAVVLGLTPFTGGLSLGLVALGGMMVVGGVNSGINHFSMAATGKGYNLIGNLTTTAGQWYNSSLGKSLGQDGVGGFVNGFVSGAGEMVSGMAQFSVYDTGKSVVTLATNAQARAQFGSAVGNWGHQLLGGNAFVAGQTTAVVATFVVGGAEIKSAVSIAKASEVESVFSKIGVFTKALGKASLENGKSLLTMPGRAVDNIGNKLTDIRELLGGKGLNYAFAHAGEGRSVLNVVGKGADDLPRNGVRNSFSKVVGESSGATSSKIDNILGDVAKEHPVKSSFEVENPKYADTNGRPDWSQAPNGGYDMKQPIIHNVGEQIQAGDKFDRFGPENGGYVSPQVDDKSFTYDSRSLPYKESSMEYHQ